jgi:DNA-binding CsgD family transcriptional regulator
MESVRNKASRDRIIVRFEIGDHPLAVVPRPESAESLGSGRELAHFVINGAAYALVRDVLVPPASTAARSPVQLLTARELQIAALVAQGMLNKEVADRLHISEWTVCAHLRRIYSKLGVSTRSAMVYLCASFVRQSAAE